MSVMDKSPRFALVKDDLRKVGKGLLIALAGAALTYLAEVVPQIDFGSYTPVVTATFSVLVNLGWKFVRAS